MKVKLKEYVDTRFDAMIRATDLAREATDARLQSLNEWRTTYGDLQNNLPTREEMQQGDNTNDTRITDLTRRLGTTENAVANLQGRLLAGGIGVSIFSLLVAVILHYLH